MVGMISGLYGGLLGLPLPGHSLSEPLVNLEFSLLQQADQLLRQWAGAGSQQWQQPHTSLVAAPRIIRSG